MKFLCILFMVALIVSNSAHAAPPEFPGMKGEYFGQAKPGPKAEPFALQMIAFRPDNYIQTITFSPCGKEAF